MNWFGRWPGYGGKYPPTPLKIAWDLNTPLCMTTTLLLEACFKTSVQLLTAGSSAVFYNFLLATIHLLLWLGLLPGLGARAVYLVRRSYLWPWEVHIRALLEKNPKEKKKSCSIRGRKTHLGWFFSLFAQKWSACSKA